MYGSGADLGWGQWFVEHLSACADPAMTQPVSKVGRADTQQGRGGHEVLISLTDHTHLLPSPAPPPHLHVAKVQDSGEGAKDSHQLVAVETKQLESLSCVPEF